MTCRRVGCRKTARIPTIINTAAMHTMAMPAAAATLL